jgi:hypothetical protein
MRRTAILLPFWEAPVGVLHRLEQIVRADPKRLRLMPYHQRGMDPHNPWCRGFGGGAGMRHAWILEAADSVTAEEVREIGAILEGEVAPK